MARAGSMNAPGPFNFHKSRTSLCSRVSKTQFAWGSTRATCQFLLGSWQTRNAPALQAGLCGSVTHRLHQFHRGENEIQVSLISFASVGATPAPRYHSGEVIRLPACKSGVAKQNRK